MKVIKPSYQIITDLDSIKILTEIEKAGRTCYKSEERITDESAPKFVKMIIGKHHDSVIEHAHMSVRFICDRGVSHELVRHRLASFSQESTRYCNYTKGKFGSELTFILPNWLKSSLEDVNNFDQSGLSSLSKLPAGDRNWVRAMLVAEFRYNKSIDSGWTPQEARSILPNSLKTEIVVTSNLRHWREIFKQRVHKSAHPQMRELMQPLLDEVKVKIPIIFDDINY